MTKIQVALDFLKFRDALKIAKAVSKYVDWIEAGTPLIKSEGISVITKLKKKFKNKKIVADLKTMDTGAFEAEMALKAGADVVTVLGAADDKTIKDAISSARKYRKTCVVDLINTKPERWNEIKKLKPDYLGIHVGIDQQKRGMDPSKQLEKLIGQKTKGNGKKIKVVVAGGINKSRIKELVNKKVDVIIIGGAITKAKNPGKEAKEIRKELDKWLKR